MSLMLGKAGTRIWTVVNTGIKIRMNDDGDWDAYIVEESSASAFMLVVSARTKAEALLKVEQYIRRKLAP